jgi:hypothetical protein
MAARRLAEEQTMPPRFLVLALFVAISTSAPRAAEPGSIGILPFDVSTVEGGGGSEAGRVLGTLVRIEMLKNENLRPQILPIPEGARMPLISKQALEVGRTEDVEYVLVGTVLEATTTRSTNRANTSRLGGAIGTAVGGSLSRVTSKVSLHAELMHAASGRTERFEVEGTNTDTGVGADLWTALGGFNVGDDGWQNSPMGKALREAAQRLTTEIAVRVAKR